MPDKDVQGVLKLGIPHGPAAPRGQELMIENAAGWNDSIYQLFSAFEGKLVRIQLTVLDAGPAERKGPRTIRDLTAPRY